MIAKKDIENIGVAIVEHEGRILLVKRNAGYETLTWQFPAGKVKSDETSKDCAVRECMNETGVKVYAYKKLGHRHHPETGKEIHYWLCKYIRGNANNRDIEENESVEWVAKKDVLARFTSDTFEKVKDFLLS